MIIKKPKVLLRLITLLTLTIGIVYASNILSSKSKGEEVHFSKLTTAQLQLEVEKLSIEGKLPFEMGLALIKRWQIAPQVQ